MTENVENYKDKCRCCMHSRGLVPVSHEEMGLKISELLLSCVSIVVIVEEQLPDRLCLLCVSQLREVFKFRSQCHQSEARLRHLISGQASIKQEITVTSEANANCYGVNQESFVDNVSSHEDDNVKSNEATEHVNTSWREASKDKLTKRKKISGSNAKVKSFRRKKCLKELKLKKEVSANEEDAKIVGPYFCDICGHCKISKKELVWHMKTMCEKISYQCEKCNKCFTDYKQYRVHKGRKKHGACSSTRIKCKKQSRRRNLKLGGQLPENNEQQNKTGRVVTKIKKEPDNLKSGKRFSCVECDKTFTYKSSLTEHLRLHTGELPYQCTECDQHFRTHRHLRDHNVKHNPMAKSVRSYSCDLCEKQFKYASSLKEHRRIHTGETPYSCGQCGQAYRMYSQLRDHMHKHNPHSKVKRFACDECDKKFLHASSLQEHRRLHTGETPYQCSVCGQTFRLALQLRHHAVKHTQEKTHTCEMCGMKFYLKGTLRNHIASHMQGRPYACEFCPKAFSTLHGRLTHTKLHLGQKDFQCPHCPKTFVAKAGMQDHSNIHTGLRPYKCLVCERSFPSRQTRRCHMASHSLTKDYVCHICNERFQHPNTLSSHKRKKHNATKCTRVEPVILTKPNVAPTHSEHTLNR